MKSIKFCSVQMARTLVLAMAVALTSGCGSMGAANPTQAVSLLDATVSGKYTCYMVPSAYYTPGTIVRIEADTTSHTNPKAGAQPIVSFGSPMESFQSKGFADEWSVEWKDTTIDVDGKVSLLAKYFTFLTADSEAKLKASRELTLKANMTNVKELLLYDDAASYVRAAVVERQEDLQPNYIYYWIKAALMPEKVSYTAVPSSSVDLSLVMKTKALPVEVTVKTGQSGAGGNFKASGVINCIYPERITITAKDKLVGEPAIEVSFHPVTPVEASVWKVNNFK